MVTPVVISVNFHSRRIVVDVSKLRVARDDGYVYMGGLLTSSSSVSLSQTDASSAASHIVGSFLASLFVIRFESKFLGCANFVKQLLLFNTVTRN